MSLYKLSCQLSKKEIYKRIYGYNELLKQNEILIGNLAIEKCLTESLKDNSYHKMVMGAMEHVGNEYRKIENENKKLKNALSVLIDICENNTKLNLSNYKKLIEDNY